MLHLIALLVVGTFVVLFYASIALLSYVDSKYTIAEVSNFSFVKSSSASRYLITAISVL